MLVMGLIPVFTTTCYVYYNAQYHSAQRCRGYLPENGMIYKSEVRAYILMPQKCACHAYNDGSYETETSARQYHLCDQARYHANNNKYYERLVLMKLLLKEWQ